MVYSDIPTISYTQVSSYFSCPAKVKYMKAKVKTPKSAPLIYGSIFHAALAAALTGPRIDMWNLMGPYLAGNAPKEDAWDGTITYGDNDWQPDIMVPWMETAVDMILATPSRPQMTELKLTKTYPEFRLVGVIDALWAGKLVDFKLAGRTFKPDPLQAACYSILNGGPSEFEFWAVRKEKTPRLEIAKVKEANDPLYLNWVVDRVLTPVAQAIQAGHFPANPTFQFCRKEWCSYWSICRR